MLRSDSIDEIKIDEDSPLPPAHGVKEKPPDNIEVHSQDRDKRSSFSGEVESRAISEVITP